MAEEPQESSAFDVSDLETTAAETPKAKRKRHTTIKAVPGGKPSSSHLPGVHDRPKKPGRKASSEGKLSASASGAIGMEAKSDVEESLAALREIERDRQREEQAAEAKVIVDREALKTPAEKLEEAEWDEKIAESKKKAEEEGQVIEFEAEPQSDAERDEPEWEAKIAEAKARLPEKERADRIAKMGDRVDKAMAEEDAAAQAARQGRMAEMGDRVDKAMAKDDEMQLSEQEAAWFRQGEDASAMKAASERQQIEDLRKGIASYDEGKGEAIIDTQEEIDAAVKRVEGMLKSGELNMDMFDVRDYEFLLTEQARLDRELEHAGWWAARKLHKELNEARKSLADYERQLESVERERADARDKAKGLPSIPARKVQAREGSGTTMHKEGSGTSIYQDKKPGFFARLFGRK